MERKAFGNMKAKGLGIYMSSCSVTVQVLHSGHPLITVSHDCTGRNLPSGGSHWRLLWARDLRTGLKKPQNLVLKLVFSDKQ
jgi:hypothetical protein